MSEYDCIWADFDLQQQLKSKEIKKKEFCCETHYLIEREGCVVCIGCGKVDDMVILDDKQEYCEFQDMSHTKTNPLFPNSNGTFISGKSKISQMSKWSNMAYEDRVLWEVSNEMKAKMLYHFSDKIINDSIYNFKTLDSKRTDDGKKEIHRGRIRKGLIAACVYFACEHNKLNKTPEDISKIMDIDTTTFNKCTKIYTEMMNESQQLKSSCDFVDNYCNALKLNFKINKVITSICISISKLCILDGSIPQNITCGVIYFVANEMNINITQKQLSETFSVSENTLNKIYKTINQHKNAIFSDIKANK